MQCYIKLYVTFKRGHQEGNFKCIDIFNLTSRRLKKTTNLRQPRLSKKPVMVYRGRGKVGGFFTWFLGGDGGGSVAANWVYKGAKENWRGINHNTTKPWGGRGGETKSFEPPPLPQSKSWWLTMTGRKVIIFLMKKQLPSLFYGDFKQRSCVHQYGYTMGMAAALRGEECVSLGRDIQQLLL